ncbi:MAG: bifunctional precorrin-2 dehydrogenase/sirohydrochlorin ferrochelatase [Bacteroidota bacterium]
MNLQTSVSQNLLFPVFLKAEEMNILLVGAGYVGNEKASGLLKNSPNTRLKIIAEAVSKEVAALKVQFPQITIQQKLFEEKDLEGVQVLILAINNRPLSAHIREVAHKLNILVNVADTPDLCDFYLSSVVQKGNLKIAVSTNGKSPTVAKRIRELLEDILPDEIDELLENINRIRDSVKGDFAEKVKKLNELTASLSKKGGDIQPK